MAIAFIGRGVRHLQQFVETEPRCDQLPPIISTAQLLWMRKIDLISRKESATKSPTRALGAFCSGEHSNCPKRGFERLYLLGINSERIGWNSWERAMRKKSDDVADGFGVGQLFPSPYFGPPQANSGPSPNHVMALATVLSLGACTSVAGQTAAVSPIDCRIETRPRIQQSDPQGKSYPVVINRQTQVCRPANVDPEPSL